MTPDALRQLAALAEARRSRDLAVLDALLMEDRRLAAESGVPIHHDPPTARALHATVGIGAEIAEDQYRAVAAAIPARYRPS